MGRIKKQNSEPLEKAKVRAAALRSIDAALDLGNGRTLAAYEAAANETQNNLNDYNQLLSRVDEAYNKFLASEKELADWSEAMLIGVANKYGKNSNEYEMAGGTRKSERKKPVRKKQ